MADYVQLNYGYYTAIQEMRNLPQHGDLSHQNNCKLESNPGGRNELILFCKIDIPVLAISCANLNYLLLH